MKTPKINLHSCFKNHLGKEYSNCFGTYNGYYTIDILLFTFKTRHPKRHLNDNFIIKEISKVIQHEILHYVIENTKDKTKKWRPIYSFFEEYIIHDFTGDKYRFDLENYTELIQFEEEDENDE